MHKLIKILMVFAFAVTALFATGCNNGDDWVNNTPSPVPYGEFYVDMTIGIQAPALSAVRADAVIQSVTFQGAIFGYSKDYTDPTSGIKYNLYTGTLKDAQLQTITSTSKAVIVYNGITKYIDSSYFSKILGITGTSMVKGELFFNSDLSAVTKATINNNTTDAPKIIDDEKYYPAELTLDGMNVIAKVPDELGTVYSLVSWSLIVTNNGKTYYFNSYTGTNLFTVNPSNGNSFLVVPTIEGKEKLRFGETYVGYLESAVVRMTDGKEFKLIGKDSVRYTRNRFE